MYGLDWGSAVGVGRAMFVKCPLGRWSPRRYTFSMTLTLDPATEQRIQREIERGHYREPAEVS